MKADLSQLNNFGSAREILEGKETSPLTQFVQANLQQLVEEIKKKGNQMDVRASNSLLTSIIPQNIVASQENISADITADEYWKFINYGVNGRLFNGAPNWSSLGVTSQPFEQLVEKIKQWMPFRNIQPRGDDTIEETATAIALATIRNGKRPRPFITETAKETKVFQEMAAGIGQLIGKSVAINLKYNLEHGNNNSK